MFFRCINLPYWIANIIFYDFLNFINVLHIFQKKTNFLVLTFLISSNVYSNNFVIFIFWIIKYERGTTGSFSSGMWINEIIFTRALSLSLLTVVVQCIDFFIWNLNLVIVLFIFLFSEIWFSWVSWYDNGQLFLH